MYTPNFCYNPYGYSYRGLPVLHQYPVYYYDRQMFPPINTKQFIQSTKKFRILVNEANKIITKITTSPRFAHDLMDAAQKDNQSKVDQLIQSTGITVKAKSHYTPDGIVIELTNAKYQGDCCTLRLGLNW
ncbi:hypothetical protein [Lederbergia citrisecunda]|uniref:hypothetical protein n=1 Tax=Lederbergia citrisecunda TaxID=2833583 RepID=UPI001F2AD5F3|nr:hypothetical protein [Lederbergia citrisecunda]